MRKNAVRLKAEVFTPENSWVPYTKTENDKAQQKVKEAIDNCIKELQEIQTKLMTYKRNNELWATKSSIKAMRRNIQSTNRNIQTVIGNKKDMDTTFR